MERDQVCCVCALIVAVKRSKVSCSQISDLHLSHLSLVALHRITLLRSPVSSRTEDNLTLLCSFVPRSACTAHNRPPGFFPNQTQTLARQPSFFESKVCFFSPPTDFRAPKHLCTALPKTCPIQQSI